MNFFIPSTGNPIIHYRWIDSDKYQTFVFINALGTDFRIWESVTGRLKSSGNILCFDKQGHGLSSISSDTTTLGHFMNDLVSLMKHIGISKCTLVGLSVGGMIAQLMAYHHPELIDKLILCNTRHKIGDEAGWNARIEQVKQGGVAGIAESILQRWFSNEFRQSNPGTVSGIRTMLERGSTQGYIQTCMAIRDADLTEMTKQIRHKTLVIVGSEDGSTPVNDVKSLADIIPGSRFEVMQGSGHLPCVDNAEKLCTLLLEFL